MNKQIEALKMAIEALEEGFGTLECEGMLPHRYQETIQSCKEALAEAEKQEPVAKGFIRTLVSVDSNGIEKWKQEPFYTHPATWQSLSDDEIFELHHKWIINSGNKDTQYDFARAVEQALKEKNHA